MFKTFRILFFILCLGVFILPTQKAFAQGVEKCQEMPSECCKTESCNADHSKNQTSKDNCGSDCESCHFCTVNISLCLVSAEIFLSSEKIFVARNTIVDTYNSTFSETINDIWQPPQIG